MIVNMAFLEKEYEVSVEHISTSNLISNLGILSILENVACSHSDMVGYGINQVSLTHFSWILLNWKVKVFKRVPYASKLKVKTWARSTGPIFTLRDFELYDVDNNVVCIAASKCVLVNTETQSISKIPEEVIANYNPEEKSVFNENDISKLKSPNIETSTQKSFKVQRRDIDFNKHMHNLYYLSYAYEVLPENIFNNEESNNFEIMYKTGAKLDDTIICSYIEQDDSHLVVIKNQAKTKLHAIVKLYK